MTPNKYLHRTVTPHSLFSIYNSHFAVCESYSLSIGGTSDGHSKISVFNLQLSLKSHVRVTSNPYITNWCNVFQLSTLTLTPVRVTNYESGVTACRIVFQLSTLTFTNMRVTNYKSLNPLGVLICQLSTLTVKTVRVTTTLFFSVISEGGVSRMTVNNSHMVHHKSYNVLKKQVWVRFIYFCLVNINSHSAGVGCYNE